MDGWHGKERPQGISRKGQQWPKDCFEKSAVLALQGIDWEREIEIWQEKKKKMLAYSQTHLAKKICFPNFIYHYYYCRRELNEKDLPWVIVTGTKQETPLGAFQ